MAKSAVTPSTTYDFKLVSLPNNKSINIDIASKLTVLANNTFKMRGLTVVTVNTNKGLISGLQRGRSGDVRKLELALQNGELVEAPQEVAAAHPVERECS
jgi:hypothetical protein